MLVSRADTCIHRPAFVAPYLRECVGSRWWSCVEEERRGGRGPPASFRSWTRYGRAEFEPRLLPYRDHVSLLLPCTRFRFSCRSRCRARRKSGSQKRISASRARCREVASCVRRRGLTFACDVCLSLSHRRCLYLPICRASACNIFSDLICNLRNMAGCMVATAQRVLLLQLSHP